VTAARCSGAHACSALCHQLALTNLPSPVPTACIPRNAQAQFKCAANFQWVSVQSTEGSGLVVDWSFFESCHGKCLCDPEGGALKNAAKAEELRSTHHVMKDAYAFYEWAATRSGLDKPLRDLEEKEGKGIFRRFFYWIPAKGVGAVDRSRLPTYKADGTSKLHEFVDIGVPGTVSTRRAACHMCARCWDGEREQCENLRYTGPPRELKIVKEGQPTTSLERVTRAQLERQSADRALSAAVHSTVCVETHSSEQTVPWCLARVLEAAHPAPAAEGYEDAGIRFINVKEGERALKVQLFEPIEPGSSMYTPSDLEVLVPARSVRLVDVTLKQLNVRQSERHVQARPQRERFELDKKELKRIRAEMPTHDDEWSVESVLQYRTYYRKEQWLVKWMGYGHDRNTWEPWENLLSEQVQQMAKDKREEHLAAKASEMAAAGRAREERARERARGSRGPCGSTPHQRHL